VSVPIVGKVPFACDVCLSAPCLTRGFCDAGRVADAQQQQSSKSETRARPTPQSTIEAIMWTVRERGPQALHEPANIKRLSRCDDAAISEIDGRIKKLEGGRHAS
jgi:hypothetical protein